MFLFIRHLNKIDLTDISTRTLFIDGEGNFEKQRKEHSLYNALRKVSCYLEVSGIT